jgi:co-chaperonin GroES (HSP10)
MKPIGSYIIIKEVAEQSESTNSGLLLTVKNKNEFRYIRGEVLEIGTEVCEHIKKGDHVYYDKHAGFEMPVKGEIFLVIKERDVVVVI